MTLYQFNSLPKDNQYDEVLNGSGVYLDNHIQGNQRFNLYAIDRFFVQIQYDSQKNEIVGLRSFKTGKLLDRYSNLKTDF
jgi:hypothetical protein